MKQTLDGFTGTQDTDLCKDDDVLIIKAPMVITPEKSVSIKYRQP